MPPKVSSLFAGGRTRPPSAAQRQLTLGDGGAAPAPQLESIIQAEDAKRPKYIFAALERAEERRAIADRVRELRNERELAKLEREQGKFMRFCTTESGRDVIVEEADTAVADSAECVDEAGDVAAAVDFEELRRRYMKRAEERDILRLAIKQEKMDLIVNFAQMIKEDN